MVARHIILQGPLESTIDLRSAFWCTHLRTRQIGNCQDFSWLILSAEPPMGHLYLAKFQPAVDYGLLLTTSATVFIWKMERLCLLFKLFTKKL